MSLCDDCYYLSVTRYGRVCNFNGAYNPHRKECPNFKPKESESHGKMLVYKILEEPDPVFGVRYFIVLLSKERPKVNEGQEVEIKS